MLVGVFHILVFYFLWLFGEVYLKAHHFRLAWHVARGQEAVRERTHTAHRTAMYLAAPSHLFVDLSYDWKHLET